MLPARGPDSRGLPAGTDALKGTCTSDMQARSKSERIPNARDGRDANDGAAERRRVGAAVAPQRLDLGAILSAAGETAYQWDVGSDCMTWAPNAPQILQIPGVDTILTGSAFALLIDPKHASRRYETVTAAAEQDRGPGAAYRLQYRLLPKGRRDAVALWLEEQGRCYRALEGQSALAIGVLRVITDRYAEDQRLLFLSQHDELTGQLNRVRLTECIHHRLEQLAAKRGAAAFVMAGVNNLSHINDTFGFEIGDEVLAVVGRRLKECLREGDSIGRYGSNKFGLVIGECGPDQVHAIASRLIRSVREAVIKTAAGSIAASVRLGAVLMPQHADTVQHVLGRSLEALEWTRARHGANFALYAPSEKRETRRRRNIAIADQVIQALNEGRMLLALQPVITAGSREVAFHECLLRMRERDGTLVAAEEFIPIAEQLGLINLIDHRAACLAIELLESSPGLKLGLNVSGETAIHGDWLELLRTLTRSDRALTERLTIEITETAAISDIGESMRFVDALKELGCRVAIDDFGAGHWSFRALRYLEPDMVKIDGSFIRNLAHSTDDWLFVRALVDLARNFGMETVAEWIEDETTAKLLEEGGITFMQGFHFGLPELTAMSSQEPVPVHELEARKA